MIASDDAVCRKLKISGNYKTKLFVLIARAPGSYFPFGEISMLSSFLIHNSTEYVAMLGYFNINMKTTQTLNNTQRNMLTKLYTEKINNALNEFKEKEKKERNELDAKLVEKNKLANKAKKMLEESKRLQEQSDKIEREAQAIVKDMPHFYTGYCIGVAASSDHPEIKKLEEKQEARQTKMNELKNKILTDIWGMTASYDEMVSTIEKAIAAVMAE